MTGDRIMCAAEMGEMDYLRSLADRLTATGHGDKGPLIAEAIKTLSCSEQTIYRKVRKFGYRSNRKLREDKGDVSVSDDELRAVANIMVESCRANGKRLLPCGDAIDIALANGKLSVNLSPNTAMRIMRQRGYHPDQIARPTPHVTMASLHPNHCWQFDVSVCVLFYLDKGGLCVMDEKRFYKNKPHNLKKIVNQRVLRYLVTDHYTGTAYVHYYLVAGEDQETLFNFLMTAFNPRAHAQDPLHGVPWMLVWDLGSANQSFLIRNLLERLDVQHMAHLPGNPRGKGQVECAHNLVETKFEGRLSFEQVESIDQLNAMAHIWMRNFNGTQIHSRHGNTRYGLWQTIRQDQLRLAPAVDLCRLLLRTKPEPRQVKGNLVVQYTVKGFEPAFYSVAHVPHVRVGETVDVCVNPYAAPAVFVIATNSEGKEQQYACEPIGRDAGGFLVGAPVIGRDYHSTPDTDTDRHRKAMAKDAYGVETQQEVDEARRQKQPAYGGQLDTIGYLEAQTVAHYMERRGTEIPLEVPRETIPPLTPVQACRRLAQKLDRNLTPRENTLVRTLYPQGVPEEELDALLNQLSGQQPTAVTAITRS